MRAIEVAVAQGHLMATVKGYAEKRQRRDGAATQTGPNLSGWAQLAGMFPDRVQVGGERLVH